MAFQRIPILLGLAFASFTAWAESSAPLATVTSGPGFALTAPASPIQVDQEYWIRVEGTLSTDSPVSVAGTRSLSQSGKALRLDLPLTGARSAWSIQTAGQKEIPLQATVTSWPRLEAAHPRLHHRAISPELRMTFGAFRQERLGLFTQWSLDLVVHGDFALARWLRVEGRASATAVAFAVQGDTPLRHLGGAGTAWVRPLLLSSRLHPWIGIGLDYSTQLPSGRDIGYRNLYGPHGALALEYWSGKGWMGSLYGKGGLVMDHLFSFLPTANRYFEAGLGCTLSQWPTASLRFSLYGRIEELDTQRITVQASSLGMGAGVSF